MAERTTIYMDDAINLLEELETKRLQGDIGLLYAPMLKGLKALPPAQPDKEKISDALYNVYRNKGTSTSAEGVAAIKYYIAEIWRAIFGEEGPGWMK